MIFYFIFLLKKSAYLLIAEAGRTLYSINSTSWGGKQLCAVTKGPVLDLTAVGGRPRISLKSHLSFAHCLAELTRCL